MSDDNKVERLLNLTLELSEAERPVSAAELQKRIHLYPEDKKAFRRTFERDKKELKEQGVPIEVKEVPGSNPPVEGYVIPKANHYLPDMGLLPEEHTAIAYALHLIDLGDKSANSALRKLGGDPLGDEKVRPRIFLTDSEHIETVSSAVLNKRQISFIYRNESGEVAERRFLPWQLFIFNGYWHIWGYDMEKKDERRFRLDRIEGEIGFLEAADAKPKKSGSFLPPRPWEFGEGDPITARLRVEKESADWAIGQMSEKAKISKEKDGSAILEFPVTSVRHFIRFVLNFFDKAEILGEEPLREEMVDYLKELNG